MNNSEKKLWFKRKKYGWGWYPSSWEGWTVFLGWVVLFSIGEVVFIQHLPTDRSWQFVVAFLVYVVAITTVLIFLSYKYGETPRWQWGEEKKKN